MLENTPNQPTKFRIKSYIKISDNSRGTYNTNGQIKFTTFRVRSSLCDYSDAYILVNWTITITGQGDDDTSRQLDKRSNI